MPIQTALEVVDPLSHIPIARIEAKYRSQRLQRLVNIAGSRMGNRYIIPESHRFV